MGSQKVHKTMGLDKWCRRPRGYKKGAEDHGVRKRCRRPWGQQKVHKKWGNGVQDHGVNSRLICNYAVKISIFIPCWAQFWKKIENGGGARKTRAALVIPMKPFISL